MDVRFLKPHLAINVRDVPTSVEFYRNLFGVEPAKVRTGYAKFDVTNPALNFTLNQNVFQEVGALSHMGFQVSSTEDVLAVRKQWHERGLVTRDEMHTDCCFATQDKTWVRDPDGNEWEVFVVLRDHLPENSAASESTLCAATGCEDHADDLAQTNCACRSQPSTTKRAIFSGPKRTS